MTNVLIGYYCLFDLLFSYLQSTFALDGNVIETKKEKKKDNVLDLMPCGGRLGLIHDSHFCFFFFFFCNKEHKKPTLGIAVALAVGQRDHRLVVEGTGGVGGGGGGGGGGVGGVDGVDGGQDQIGGRGGAGTRVDAVQFQAEIAGRFVHVALVGVDAAVVGAQQRRRRRRRRRRRTVGRTAADAVLAPRSVLAAQILAQVCRYFFFRLTKTKLCVDEIVR